MQEAFGGTFMLKLFMIFFIIYVCFIGVALNFAKTYRIKNYVINVLEQYQYTGEANDSALTKLDNYLAKVPYTTPEEVAESDCRKYSDDPEDVVTYKGVCIVKEGEDEAPFYKVVVYFVAEFPFFDLNITIPASGETKVIYME